MAGNETTFRRIDRSAYPELRGYSDEEIWRDNMGPGALYLAARMSRHLDVKKGGLVLDLGCGRGESSIFLAKHLGVRVIAVDLWTEARPLADKFKRSDYSSQILPMTLDARKALPFAEEYFDAVFCMNSFNFYGDNVAFLRHLLKHLKPGGQLCIGSEVLTDEFTEEQLKNIRSIQTEYAKSLARTGR